MEEKRERIKKRESPIVNVLYISFWSLIIVMFTALFFFQMENYNEKQAELARVNANLAQEKAAYEQLEYELSLFDSDAYIEQLARDRLGMVRENEIIFRNIAE